MRSQMEILSRIKKLTEDGDIFGFQKGDLIEALTFDNAKAFINEEHLETAEKEWDTIPSTDESVKKRAIDYVEFAWGKANDGRSISASRSIAHFQAWMWLLGSSVELVEGWADYQHYGKDELRDICELLGVDPDEHDDGVRTNKSM